jgi:adhesin/invasin
VLTSLPAPIKVQDSDPYSGVGIPGVTVTFSDGGKGGTFNPTTAVTDSSGDVSTTYTFPSKSGTYILTASATNFPSLTVNETALPGPPVKLISWSGAGQTGTVGSVLPKPIIAQVRDAYNNGVPGVTVNFAPAYNGVVNPTSVVTDPNGKASTIYQLPTKAGKFSVTATSSGLNKMGFPETSVAGPAANIGIVSGNNQTGFAGTQLPTALAVKVTDQYGNPVSGTSVAFSDGGAAGVFSNANPTITDTTGTASQFYTLPPVAGTVKVSATAAGIANPAVFTETAE